MKDLVGVELAGGRYRITSGFGNGSMAWVMRATDSRLLTDVVVKVPRPSRMADREILSRFRRESRLMVQLSHPHIVKVLDVGEYKKLPYVVMQLLTGGTLSDRIAREPKGLSPDSLRSWIREVARALDFCCRKGTVHRDVKPANILFDEDGNAYVSDFGLTKIMFGEYENIDPSETAAGQVLGTPNYMAPEIVLGRKYDGRADQYSLGLTVYHALFGRPPMQGDSSTETMINQTQKQLKLLSDIRPDVPQELALAVRKSIEKKPDDRFASCEEFAEAVIRGLQAQEPSPTAESDSSDRLSLSNGIRSADSIPRAEQQDDVPDMSWLNSAATASDSSASTHTQSASSSFRRKRTKQNHRLQSPFQIIGLTLAAVLTIAGLIALLTGTG